MIRRLGRLVARSAALVLTLSLPASAQQINDVTIGVPLPATFEYDRQNSAGPHPNGTDMIGYAIEYAGGSDISVVTLGDGGPVDYIALSANFSTAPSVPSGIADLTFRATTRGQMIARYGAGLVNADYGNASDAESGYLAYRVNGAFMYMFFAQARLSSGAPASDDINDAVLQSITMISMERARLGQYLAANETAADVPAVSFP